MKGSNAERELCTELWDRNYATLRAPGSGSIQRPSPDVVALRGINPTDVIAIELKAASDGTATFTDAEIMQLEEWADRCNAIALVGIKPDLRKFDGWLFMETLKLNKTEKGYSIRKQDHNQTFGFEWFEWSLRKCLLREFVQQFFLKLVTNLPLKQLL